MTERHGRLASALSSIGQSASQPQLPVAEETTLTEMLRALGLALIFSNNPVVDAEETLLSLATSYGKPELRIVCLPTFVLIEDPTADPPRPASSRRTTCARSVSSRRARFST